MSELTHICWSMWEGGTGVGLGISASLAFGGRPIPPDGHWIVEYSYLRRMVWWIIEVRQAGRGGICRAEAVGESPKFDRFDHETPGTKPRAILRRET